MPAFAKLTSSEERPLSWPPAVGEPVRTPGSSPAGLTSAFVPPPTAPIRRNPQDCCLGISFGSTTTSTICAAAGPARNPKIVERAAAFHIISGHRLIGGMGKDAVLALADHGVIDRADAREHLTRHDVGARAKAAVQI